MPATLKPESKLALRRVIGELNLELKTATQEVQERTRERDEAQRRLDGTESKRLVTQQKIAALREDLGE